MNEDCSRIPPGWSLYYLGSSAPILHVSSLLLALYSAEIQGLELSPLSMSPSSVTKNLNDRRILMRKAGS